MILLQVTKNYRIANTDRRDKTGVPHIIKEIKTKKLRRAGHVAMKHDNKWTNRMTDWTPMSRVRRRGRHDRRWRD